MRSAQLSAVVAAALVVAACHQSAPGASSAAPSADTPGSAAGTSAQGASAQTPPGPQPKPRRPMTRERPKWPEPLPEGCKRALSIGVDLLPNGKVESAWVIKSACPAVDDLAIKWVKAVEFEPDPTAKGADTQTVIMNWTFDAP